MIEVDGLTKRFGGTIAVDNLSFAIKPGVVTGFLGPNGAGKSTTMRMILGLDRPTRGSVTVNGKSYKDLPAPIHEVGALLDAKAVQGGRTAYQHLKWLAQANQVNSSRIDEVLDVVGLTGVARRTIGGFSLGMSQRLGIASALLGDPQVLLFDEPVNGLDPEGIVWIRNLLKRLATEGRTVLVSSHLMNEMEDTADHVVVIGRGRLIADMSMSDFRERATRAPVRVMSPDAARLVDVLVRFGASFSSTSDGALLVMGMGASEVGDLAAENQIRLHELSQQRASLEAAFMQLTHDDVEYQAASAAA
jgi:ABC-2 type transport system ATP-binding protein